MGHSERRENLLANGAFPAQAGELSFEVAHGRNGEVVVLVGAAKAFVGLAITETADEVFAAEVRGIPNEIMPRKAGAVREKVARRGLLAGNRIVHLKFGEIAADGLIPIDFAFVFENGEGERGERLGYGADGEKRRGGHRKFLFQ